MISEGVWAQLDESPMSETVVVIPTMNEERHIARVLADVMRDAQNLQVWVIDGGSTDKTCDIVHDWALRWPQISLFANPNQTQAYAINLGAQQAQTIGARVLVRIDAHARYPKGFIDGVVRTLDAERADSVVTPLIARGHGHWRGATAILQRCWLGHGGATHRVMGARGWVDHGHHAAFRLTAFAALGGYDVRFRANEDAEYDARLIAAGGRIYFEPRWPVTYIPRSTPLALFKQMLRNGRWRIATARKHRQPLALRQLLPLATTICVPFSLVLALWSPVMVLPAFVYLATVGLLATYAARGSAMVTLRVGALAVVSHCGFGLGALIGLLRRRYE